MVSKSINLFPEVIATLTFLPLGVYMGFITQFFFLNDVAARVLSFTEQWPHLVSSICAIVTGIVLTLGRFKETKARYRFDHFYILMIGMFVVLIGGILLASAELPYAGLYTIFAGKGVCYVAALSYLNVRIGKSRYRMLKLSVPHWVYLFGVAIGATITSTSTEQPYYPLIHYDSVIEIESIVIITMAVMLLCGYLATVSLDHQKRLDYKCSLDNDINRENEREEIFQNKHFLIEVPRSEAQSANLINTRHEDNVGKEVISIVLAMVGKIEGIAYFYGPFYFMYFFGAIIDDIFTVSFFVINWYGMIGITVSLVALCWGPYKIHFLLSSGIKMFVLVIIFTVIAGDEYYESLKLIMTIVFIVLGFGYGYSDINILSYTNLKYNEIILAFGYSVQYITIGVLQYYTVHHPTYILDLSDQLSLFYPHSISFAVIFAFVGVLAIFVLPNRNQLSLLEIKNALNRKSTVPVGHVPIMYPHNNLPPPYVGHSVYPYQNYPPGSQVALPQGSQGLIQGTNYPQYYPPPQPYAQQQMPPQYYPQQQPPYLAYGAMPIYPGTQPPNYIGSDAGHTPQMPIDPSQITPRSNKVTEL